VCQSRNCPASRVRALCLHEALKTSSYEWTCPSIEEQPGQWLCIRLLGLGFIFPRWSIGLNGIIIEREFLIALNDLIKCRYDFSSRVVTGVSLEALAFKTLTLSLMWRWLNVFKKKEAKKGAWFFPYSPSALAILVKTRSNPGNDSEYVLPPRELDYSAAWKYNSRRRLTRVFRMHAPWKFPFAFYTDRHTLQTDENFHIMRRAVR